MDDKLTWIIDFISWSICEDLALPKSIRLS